MMLCKLSLKNLSRSIRDYAIYFFTLILGVAIFYIFNAIEDQTIMMNVSASTYEIIKLMNSVLSGVSVFVAFVLGFLILYANRFLMKRRNKEFAVYMTLGMGKGKISMILFWETFIIGCISLIAGLCAGIVLSQFMSLFVANMFEADMSQFTFTFSMASCFKTLLYFGIMYILVIILNTFNVSRCQLIDLFNAHKKAEKIRLKNAWLCVSVFIIAVIMLSYAYSMVTGSISNFENENTILLPIGLGMISTFLIFWSLSGLLLKVFKNARSFYFKRLNSFVLRQFSSKVNTTVMSMTVICLLLFFTICILSSAISIRNSMTANLKTLVPADIELFKTLDLPDDPRYSSAQVADSRISVRETLKHLDFDVDHYFKDIIEFDMYASDEVTIRDSLGKTYQSISEKYPYLSYDQAESFVKVSDYNQVAQLYNLTPIDLKENEYVIIADFDSWIDIRNEALKVKTTICLNGHELTPRYDHCVNGFIDMSTNHINTGIMIVSDSVLEGVNKERGILIANYDASTDQEKQQIEDKILALDNYPYASNTDLEGVSKLALYEGSVGLGAMITFIGLYLGIIFLMASAAIMALKELSESVDNKERFMMLRRIGTDEKMLNHALFEQIAIFFLFPLLLAVIHAFFGIRFCMMILETFGNTELVMSIIITAVIIVFIYGGYFMITYLCSKNMMREY